MQEPFSNDEALLRIEDCISKKSNELDLSNLRLSKIPKELSKCTHLLQLDLSDNYLIRIEGLEWLKHLRTLYLSSNQIEKIEGLDKLVHLQTLYLSGNQIKQIKGMEKLTQLQTLSLYGNQISRIESLEGLKQLQELNLSHNQISKLEGLEGLAQLQKLDLSRNQVTRIEGLQMLTQLRALYLNSNRINRVKALREFIQSISKFENFHFLQLKGNDIEGIPGEIINGHIVGEGTNTCLEELIAWFADFDKGHEINYQIKLMLIGNGAAGKTSLVEALKTGTCKTSHSSTHGILIEMLHLYEGDPLQFYCWDFGGQEIYMGTHRLFLSSKGIQLIVFDPDLEKNTSSKDRVTGEKVRNLKTDYWLRVAKDLSPQSKRVVVQNKSDISPYAVKEIASLTLENGIPFIHLSALKGNNLDDLLFRLKKLAHELPLYKMQMPKSWMEVRSYFLRNMKEELPVRTISLRHFYERCLREGVEESSIQTLLGYLHDTGILYYNEQFMKDTIIADQLWALKVIYQVLDRKSSFYDFMRNEAKGKCKLKYLFSEMGTEYTQEQRELIVEFMKSCGLCFLVNDEGAQSSEKWCVFPEFLPDKISPAGELSWNSSSNKQLVDLRKAHPFLHYHTIQQFISLVSAKTDLSLIWKNGIIVHAPKGSFKVEGNFDKNLIRISIDKSADKDWAREIIYNIEGREEKNLSGWQMSRDGKTFRDLNWELFERKSKKSSYGELKHKKTESLQWLPPVKQTAPKEIVFSYAKEDLEVLELIRKHLGGLMHDNAITVWYDKNLSNTRDWDSEIMQHFESCDALIIIGSADYISPDKHYIWNQEVPIFTNRYANQEMFGIIINASSFVLPKKLSEINCFEKGKPIPSTKAKKDEFISKFIRDEIRGKLLRV